MTSYSPAPAPARHAYSQVQSQHDIPLENFSHGYMQDPPQRFQHDPSTETLIRARAHYGQPTDAQDRNTSTSKSSTEYASKSYEDSASPHILSTEIGTPRRHGAFVLGDWLWEFASAAFSLACLAAAIIVLTIYNGKALASWNFIADANLNTIIALLSTFSRTALLVPVASCISQLKWIHLVTSPRPLRDVQTFDDASRGPWGALELIWRVNFKSTLATWGSVITILTLAMGPFAQQLVSYPTRLQLAPDATFYSSQIYDSGTSRGVTAAWQRDRKMDPKMQGAIVNGLFNLSAPVQASCPTGNCRWKEYTTLGVASECTNVTMATNVTCRNPDPRSTRCNYITPGGYVIGYARSTSSGGGSSIYFNATARTASADSSTELSNSTIISFALAKFWEYSVNECSMRWVARTFSNTTVVNGTFNPGSSQTHELIGTNPSGDATAIHDWNIFQVPNGSLATFPNGTNSTFSISPTDNGQIKSFLRTVFESTINEPFGLALLNSTNMTDTLNMVSTSMTYFMGRSPSGQAVTGDSITSEQYIRVHWWWISIPVLEVGMTLAFLACTLVQTSRKGVVAWKSSGIVPLFTSMRGWDDRDFGATSWKGLEKQSRGAKGVIGQDERGGLYFQRAG